MQLCWQAYKKEDIGLETEILYMDHVQCLDKKDPIDVNFYFWNGLLVESVDLTNL